MKQTDILILGAGCSGTSLAAYLEEFGYQGKIVLLDSKTSFHGEQRWCSWAEIPDSMKDLVHKSWQEWTVCDENRSVSCASEKFSYKEIYAPHFFSYFHPRWQKSSNSIDLRLGEKVEHVTETDSFVEVTTNRETWQARIVFDARHEGSRNLEAVKNTSEVYLHQTFLGQKVEFSKAVFDEHKATLMDFRTAQTDGVNFIYVLPYSDREALIESTSFNINPLDFATHRQALEKYITENYGNNYKIRATEVGQLPMTAAKFPTKTSERIFNIGIAGGNARPSSGYAFHRIQRQTSKIAQAIVNKEVIPQDFAAAKYDFFDAVFLNLMAKNPTAAQEAFMILFDKVSPDVLIRFLTDESSVTDDLAIMLALPKINFGKFSIQTIWRNLMTKNETSKRVTSLYNPVANPAGRLPVREVSG